MSILVERGGEQLLLDCGEGTQRQLLLAGGIPQLEHIFITHGHADHTLGLIGLTRTFALANRKQPLTIYGPEGFARLYAAMDSLYGRLTYEVDVREIKPGESVRFTDFQVNAFAVNHGMRALGYAIVEDEITGHLDLARADALGVAPRQRGLLQRGESVETESGVVEPGDVLGASRRGRHVVYSGDTRPCAATIEAAKGADLLIHEASFLTDEQARAKQTHHSTALEAASVARQAGVKQLALVHIPARYFVPDIKREAKREFRHVIIPNDLETVSLPLPR
jgi:ribonuclease Z